MDENLTQGNSGESAVSTATSAGAALLVGEAEVTRDDRGRMVIARALSAPFEAEGAAMVGPAPSLDRLYLFTPSALREFIGVLKDRARMSDDEAQDYLNFYSTYYQRQKLQAPAKRVDIPKELQEMVGLEKRVCLVGRADRVMVVNASSWHRQRTEILEAIKRRAGTPSPWR